VLFALRYLLGKQKSAGARSAAEICESLLIAVVLVFLVIKPFIVQTFFIPSESMVPTLEISDHLLVNRFVYRFQSPKRGDIVVFKAPLTATDGEDKDFIKRLIGLPGDVLQIKVEGVDPLYGLPFGTLYVNGKRSEERYLDEQHHILCAPIRTNPLDTTHPSIDLRQPYKVPTGTYFMMGDNRNNSNDSRYWGPLDKSRVIGKAAVLFWPVNRASAFH
jgi:signal peptidase I